MIWVCIDSKEDLKRFSIFLLLHSSIIYGRVLLMNVFLLSNLFFLKK